jgi:hypothetical protein
VLAGPPSRGAIKNVTLEMRARCADRLAGDVEVAAANTAPAERRAPNRTAEQQRAGTRITASGAGSRRIIVAGEFKRELRACTWRARSGDAPAMQFDYAFGDGQSKARARPVITRGIRSPE